MHEEIREYCKLKKKLLIYWLRWVCIVACRLSLVAVSRGYSGDAWASRCSGFSCGFRALGAQASVVSLWHVESSQTRVEPVSPTLAGRFLTNGPPGKSKY